MVWQGYNKWNTGFKSLLHNLLISQHTVYTITAITMRPVSMFVLSSAGVSSILMTPTSIQRCLVEKLWWSHSAFCVQSQGAEAQHSEHVRALRRPCQSQGQGHVVTPLRVPEMSKSIGWWDMFWLHDYWCHGISNTINFKAFHQFISSLQGLYSL